MAELPNAQLGGGVSEDEARPAQVLKERGNAAMKQGDLDGAIRLYQEALERLTPAAEEASALHSNLALALLKVKRAEESLAAADACVAAKPSWHKAHFRRGDALFAMRQYEPALGAYETAALHAKTNDDDIARCIELTKEAIRKTAALGHSSSMPHCASPPFCALTLELRAHPALGGSCLTSAGGGVWMRQLLPGRDIALPTRDSTQQEQLIFGSAKQMKNFIYLVGDASSRECYAIDTAWDPSGIATFAARHKMRLVGALGTHYHFDHVGGAVPPPFAAMVAGPFGGEVPLLPGLREMGLEHGCKLYCHASERARVAKQCHLSEDSLNPLEQGSTLALGDEGGCIEVLHTPGHSGGSICLLVRAARGGAAHSLYVGDTIFPGSCGRLDLPDSDKAAMYDSLQTLRGLDDAIDVYPGHGYSGPSTTIANEKRSGLLRPFSREQWLAMH